MALEPIDALEKRLRQAEIAPLSLVGKKAAIRHPPITAATGREWLVLGLVLALMLGVFVFDIRTPPDDVTVCFIYPMLIAITFFSHYRAAYLCAVVSMTLSVLASFIHPPSDELSLIFFANRAIAVVAQWIMAILVTTRRDAEALLRARLDEETMKVEAGRRFLDVLSHEIGTSLTTVDGQAFRLRKLAASNDPHDVAVRADKIRQAVQHIKAMVERVQLASEAGERTLSMKRCSVDFKDLVEDVVLQSESRDTPIQTDLADMPRFVWGDADMLRQIVDNIISNAIKYSPSNAPILVRGRGEGNNAVLSVTDHGRGIPNDEIEKLFTPYYRARNSRGVHGAGIGLYVVDCFLSDHGGTIDVESKIGAGTTITIRLPIGPSLLDEHRVSAAHPLH